MSRQTTSLLKALLNVEASAPVPKLSNAQMLEAPENSAIRDIWLLPPDNRKLHAGRKVAVTQAFESSLIFFWNQPQSLRYVP